MINVEAPFCEQETMNYLAHCMEKFPNLHTIRLRTQRAITPFGVFYERYYPQIRHIVTGEDNIEILNCCPYVEKFVYDWPITYYTYDLIYSWRTKSLNKFIPTRRLYDAGHQPVDAECHRLSHESYATRTSFPRLREFNLHWDLTRYVSLAIIYQYITLTDQTSSVIVI